MKLFTCPFVRNRNKCNYGTTFSRFRAPRETCFTPLCLVCGLSTDDGRRFLGAPTNFQTEPPPPCGGRGRFDPSVAVPPSRLDRLVVCGRRTCTIRYGTRLTQPETTGTDAVIATANSRDQQSSPVEGPGDDVTGATLSRSPPRWNTTESARSSRSSLSCYGRRDPFEKADATRAPATNRSAPRSDGVGGGTRGGSKIIPRDQHAAPV